MSDFDLQGLAQVSVSTDRPAHKRIVNDAVNEIAHLRSELTAARDEAERLSAREDSLWETFEKIADFLGIDCEAARNIPGKPSNVFKAAILRKQADAIDDAIGKFVKEYPEFNGSPESAVLATYSQRLRQQAESIENGE